MASLLAFALAAPQRYPAVIDPQGDGVAAAASPTAVSLNSTRMYSDYLESRVQFESATYDGCGSEIAAPQGHRFLMVVDAREQSQKSLGVVNDVAFYARALNRVLVEPGVAESRIVDPFGEHPSIAAIHTSNSSVASSPAGAVENLASAGAAASIFPCYPGDANCGGRDMRRGAASGDNERRVIAGARPARAHPTPDSTRAFKGGGYCKATA